MSALSGMVWAAMNSKPSAPHPMYPWCWDVVAAAQRSGGWSPPTLFTLAECCARFPFTSPDDPAGLHPGEAEAYTCVLARFGRPLVWVCRDVGPPSITSLEAGAVVRRVVVADALYPTRVAQHRWWVCTAEQHGSEPEWAVSRPRLRVLPLAAVTAAQRWRPAPPGNRIRLSVTERAAVQRSGVVSALAFRTGDVACFPGEGPASLLGELIDVPVTSRYLPTNGLFGDGRSAPRDTPPRGYWQAGDGGWGGDDPGDGDAGSSP